MHAPSLLALPEAAHLKEHQCLVYLADLHAWQAIISGIFKKDWSATLRLSQNFKLKTTVLAIRISTQTHRPVHLSWADPCPFLRRRLAFPAASPCLSQPQAPPALQAAAPESSLIRPLPRWETLEAGHPLQCGWPQPNR